MHAAMTGNDFGHHLTLRRCLVGQQRLADDIADGEDTAHAGAALVVDLDEFSALEVEPHVFQTPAFKAGLAADRNEDLVGGDGLFRTLRVFIGENGLAALFGDALGLAGEVHIDLVLLQPHGDRTGDLLVIERQDAIRGFDEGDLGAQLAEGDAQFEADIAGTDHDQLLRQLGQIKRIGRADHRVAERQKGQLDLDRAGGENHILGGDLDLLAIILRDDTGLGVGEFGPAGNVLGPGSLDQLADTPGQLGDDPVFPADQLAHVQLWRLGEGDAQLIAFRVLGHVLILGRRVDHRLGGNATTIEAGSAQTVLVDNDGVEAQLAGANGGRIAARATTDNENLAGTGLGHERHS